MEGATGTWSSRASPPCRTKGSPSRRLPPTPRAAPSSPAKCPAPVFPNGPPGASPPHFTHHRLPLTPKSSSVKCDTWKGAQTALRTLTAGLPREPQRGGTSPAPPRPLQSSLGLTRSTMSQRESAASTTFRCVLHWGTTSHHPPRNVLARPDTNPHPPWPPKAYASIPRAPRT